MAANECIEGWDTARWEGQATFEGVEELEAAEGFVNVVNLEATETVCEQAIELLDIDQIGVPLGPNAPNQLAFILSSIKLSISVEMLTLNLGGECYSDGYCRVPPDERHDFLDLTGVEEPAFVGEPMLGFGPSIDSIDGLVVE